MKDEGLSNPTFDSITDEIDDYFKNEKFNTLVIFIIYLLVVFVSVFGLISQVYS